MTAIASAIRPYWAHGINNIPMGRYEPLSKFIERGNDYRVYTQLEAQKFTLSVDRVSFLKAISNDCNRFCVASFESIISSEKRDDSHKAIAWTLVKHYYSAFYAGHFIIRCLGKSLTQLDKATVNKVGAVADLFGVKNGVDPERGFYLCEYRPNSYDVDCHKDNKTGEDGSHAVLWKALKAEFDFISNDILKGSTDTDLQKVSAKLAQCSKNLSYMGQNNGSWLSNIRNSINYRHDYGAWFPYSEQDKFAREIFRFFGGWKNEAMNIDLFNHEGRYLNRFVATCQFLVAVAREMVVDMNNRCSNGKSFLIAGPVALLNHSSNH